MLFLHSALKLFALSLILEDRTMTELCKSLTIPGLLYGTMERTDSSKSALGIFERKDLHKIYGPLRGGNGCRERCAV